MPQEENLNKIYLPLENIINLKFICCLQMTCLGLQLSGHPDTSQ